MKRIQILTQELRTIDWFDNKIVDWSSAGRQFSLEGEVQNVFRDHIGWGDSAITSLDGQYAFIYKKLGTKGLLIKNGKILREINRTYYCSETYEYPAAFVTINERTYLVHCPIKYSRLDFEDVETGDIITNVLNRNPDNSSFHSRLEVSPDNKYLISKGWFWHPFDFVQIFDIEACIKNPTILDIDILIPNVSTEICSASFIDNERILVCSSTEEPMNDENEEPIPPGHIAIWYFKTNEISKAVKVNGEFGNIFAIDDKYCWDLYKYPKIIDIQTGDIIDKNEKINTGLQNSSIIGSRNLTKISFNRQTKQIAIYLDEKVEVLTR